MSQINVAAYIKQLREVLPHAAPISRDRLKVLHRRKDYEGMVRLIRRAMNLDVKLRVAWVNSGGPKGFESAPAWVLMPERMPYYGTPEFKKLTLEVFIRKSFLEQNSYTKAAVAIAHELSHVVLDSIQHPLRREEKAVDIAAMLLGFSDLYRRAAIEKRYFRGRIEISGLGYLTEAELNEACRILLPVRFRVLHRLRDKAKREAPRLMLLAGVLLICLFGFGVAKWETQEAAWAAAEPLRSKVPLRIGRDVTLVDVQTGLLSVTKTFRLGSLGAAIDLDQTFAQRQVCNTDLATIKRGVTYHVEYQGPSGALVDRFQVDSCP